MKKISTSFSPKTNRAFSIFSKLFAALLLFYFMLGIYIMAIGCRNLSIPSSSLQAGIAKEVLRFHVIANSDTKTDQEIKYLIKDSIINYLKPYLVESKSKEESIKIISSHIQYLTILTNTILSEHNYNYTCTVELNSTWFPVKVYGDITLPAGTYDALCIRLGKSEGKNWWCIMFPQLCFLDDTYTVVPKDSKKELQNLLTEEEYEAILTSPPSVTYKFKLFEWIKEFFS